jgi:hypothetical protein
VATHHPPPTPEKEKEGAGRRRGREEKEIVTGAVWDTGDEVVPSSSSWWRATRHCFSAALL